MYKICTGFLIALAINILAVFSFAAGSPVILRHTLTGYDKGATTATLDYSLHVVNPGETPITSLTLVFVSLPPFITGRTVLDVGSLSPGQSVDLPLKLTVPAGLEESKVKRKPLFWAGSCIDVEGKKVEFPVNSKAGGAR